MAYDIVLHVKAKNAKGVTVNSDPYFSPLGGKLATEYDQLGIHSDRPPTKLVSIGGVLPGYQIEVDTKNKKVRVRDRLKMPENSRLLEEVKELEAKQSIPQILGENWKRDKREGFVEEQEVQCQDFEDVLHSPKDCFGTFLFHIRKLYDANKLQLFKGRLPTHTEIRKMGYWKGDRFGRQGMYGVPPNIVYPPGKEPKPNIPVAVEG